MHHNNFKKLGVFFDRYYWQTAVLIAKNGLARQYRNSFLGMLWTLFQPLMMVAVYAFIMPMIMRVSTQNFRLYILVSLPVWGFFTLSLNGASQSLLTNGETLKRCMVSSTLFPVADILRATYTFCVSFATMYGVALVIGLASLSPVILLLPLYFIPIFVTLCAVSIAVAFIAPYLRDIGDLINVSMNMLFWLTPVVYSIENLPENLRFYMNLNPFYIMLHPIQMIAYEHLIPGMGDTLRLLGLALLSVVAGFSVFGLCRRNYVYYL